MFSVGWWVVDELGEIEIKSVDDVIIMIGISELVVRWATDGVSVECLKFEDD